MPKPITLQAKVFWPDCQTTLTAHSFEALCAHLGTYLDSEFRLAPLKVEFSIKED